MTGKKKQRLGSLISAVTVFLCVWAAELGQGAATDLPALPDTASAEAMLTARSLVSAGARARLQRIMVRASQDDPVTVAVIGGSITAGAAATQPEKRYGNLVAQWWRLKFPRAKIRFVNAGIGATGSDYGALRAERDLLSKQPDFVVVEYAVNDRNTQAAAETFEGLVRQILKQPNQPAVIFLFTMNRTGDNAQEWQRKIGSHYGLPMVSFRDALWPEIQTGRRKWEDVEADQVHPNDRGHAYCAAFITAVLDEVLRSLPPKDTLPAAKALPQPLLSDLFERVALHEADALRPAVNNGWAYDPKSGAWKSDKPGSVSDAPR